MLNAEQEDSKDVKARNAGIETKSYRRHRILVHQNRKGANDFIVSLAAFASRSDPFDRTTSGELEESSIGLVSILTAPVGQVLTHSAFVSH